MDIQGALFLVVLSIGLSGSSAGTWAACRWWYGRKLLAASQRLHKSDKGRLFSQQQAQQACRQVEQLKGELATQRQAALDSDTERQLATAMAMASEAVRLHVECDDACADSEPTAPPNPHGFADTQVMP